MTSFETIENAIHDFIVAATGLEGAAVRPFYNNAPSKPTQDRTALVYFNLINPIPIGVDSKQYANQEVETDLDETIYGDRRITASIQALTDPQGGEDAREIIESISLYLRSAEGIEFLNANNLGYLTKSAVRDLSALQNGNFENRRQIDIDFHIVIDNTTSVNAIESAEISASFYGSDTITATIEVNDES
jgi:hypothetical protein